MDRSSAFAPILFVFVWLASTLLFLIACKQLACEQQTHFRSSLLSLRRERSDDRKCVGCSQASKQQAIIKKIQFHSETNEPPNAFQTSLQLVCVWVSTCLRLHPTQTQTRWPKSIALQIIIAPPAKRSMTFSKSNFTKEKAPLSCYNVCKIRLGCLFTYQQQLLNSKVPNWITKAKGIEKKLVRKCIGSSLVRLALSSPVCAV